ncbi:phage terminase small subunit [Mycolicibacterium llatzerense]|uniref:phage terminase small subunit n=1 Tax=Mycolicibacterium llatzerense TaxID=280871 RepID=UPI0021B6D6AD|nr:hypothetical protein [Mycolicibacterium llatzerense]MCT7361304.1 hypothetical protein [Mycolicibacterium llatzerense]
MPAHSKDPSVRQRRNKTATRSTLRKNENPEVPPLPAGTHWYPQVQEWWTRLWSSPMANEWTESDIDALYLAARLQQQFWNPRTNVKVLKVLSTEIRQLIERCGLTPMSRRSLQWVLPPDDEDDEDTESGTTRKPAAKKAAPKKAADPRARFRVVSGG